MDISDGVAGGLASAAQLYNALDSGDIADAIPAGMNLLNATGLTDFGDGAMGGVLSAFNLYNALDGGDYGAALTSGLNLLNSFDMLDTIPGWMRCRGWNTSGW